MTQLIAYTIFSENDYGTTQGAEMSVTVNNSPIQDYSSCMFTLQVIMLHLLIKWLLDSNILQFYIQLPYHQVAI